MNQPALFAPRSKLEREFVAFDADNPRVWELFVRFAREAIAAGRKHFSADAILHRIRWHTTVETVGAGGFKVNDHFSSHYARKFIRCFPQHAGFFETRALRSTRSKEPRP